MSQISEPHEGFIQTLNHGYEYFKKIVYNDNVPLKLEEIAKALEKLNPVFETIEGVDDPLLIEQDLELLSKFVSDYTKHEQGSIKQKISQTKRENMNKRMAEKNVHSNLEQKDSQESKDPSKGFYDVVIDIESTLGLVMNENGWKINASEGIDLEAHGEAESQKSLIVGVVGLSCKGKTFTINRLSGSQFESGFNVYTKGLSIKIPQAKQSNPLILLDSMGCETPIRMCGQNKLPFFINDDSEGNHKGQNDIWTVQKTGLRADMTNQVYIDDKIMTEDFLQSFILEQAHIIIVVVGQLTYSDQKLVFRLMKKYPKKQIIVLHNFFTLEEVSEVEKNIETDILYSFNVEEIVNKEQGSHVDEFRYYLSKPDSSGKKNAKVAHLILARENTLAGLRYNHSTFRFLKDLFSTENQSKKLPILEEIKKHIRHQIPKYLEHSSLNGNPAPDELIDLVIDPENDISKLVWKSRENKKLFVKTLSIDALGVITNEENDGFTPEYALVKENATCFHCYINISGMGQVDITEVTIEPVNAKEHVLHFRGRRFQPRFHDSLIQKAKEIQEKKIKWLEYEKKSKEEIEKEKEAIFARLDESKYGPKLAQIKKEIEDFTQASNAKMREFESELQKAKAGGNSKEIKEAEELVSSYQEYVEKRKANLEARLYKTDKELMEYISQSESFFRGNEIHIHPTSSPPMKRQESTKESSYNVRVNEIIYGEFNSTIKITGLYYLKIDTRENDQDKETKKSLLDIGIYLVKLIGSESAEGAITKVKKSRF